jgi:CorA-like Mg2+ transporter protein
LTKHQQIKKISAWAAILFAPTLVGTIYGMNFDGMPELTWVWGYPLALAMMGLVCVGLYGVFKIVTGCSAPQRACGRSQDPERWTRVGGGAYRFGT